MTVPPRFPPLPRVYPGSVLEAIDGRRYEVLSYDSDADSWWCRSLRDGKRHEIAHTVIDGEYVRVVTREDP